MSTEDETAIEADGTTLAEFPSLEDEFRRILLDYAIALGGDIVSLAEQIDALAARLALEFNAVRTEIAGESAKAPPRNLVLNPCMQISQQNTIDVGITLNAAAGGVYVADGWQANIVGEAVATIMNVTVPTPKGAQNRLRLSVSTADTTLTTTQYCAISQGIEGREFAGAKWGTAGAKNVIVRFGCNFPAGTWPVSVMNEAANRSYLTTITITAEEAGVDVVKTIVIPGDTTGTWTYGANRGIGLRFVVGSGPTYQGALGWNSANILALASSPNGLATVGNKFEIFDVGLYIDDDGDGAAPDFVIPSYEDQMRKCMRYWQTFQNYLVAGYGPAAGGSVFGDLSYAVPMRSNPGVSFANASYNNASALTAASIYTNHARIRITNTAIGNANAGADIILNARL